MQVYDKSCVIQSQISVSMIFDEEVLTFLNFKGCRMFFLHKFIECFKNKEYDACNIKIEGCSMSFQTQVVTI